jgi:predicted transcriptional regulator
MQLSNERVEYRQYMQATLRATDPDDAVEQMVRLMSTVRHVRPDNLIGFVQMMM